MEQQLNEKKEDEDKMTTEQIREYIRELKRQARALGKETLILKCGDVHNELGLKHRHPQVCNAMRDCKNENDVVLYEPQKKNSSAVTIEYKL